MKLHTLLAAILLAALPAYAVDDNPVHSGMTLTGTTGLTLSNSAAQASLRNQLSLGTSSSQSFPGLTLTGTGTTLGGNVTLASSNTIHIGTTTALDSGGLTLGGVRLTAGSSGTLATEASVSAQDVYFAIRTDGNSGTGTLFDPYDGSTSSHFDAAMIAIPIGTVSNPVCIHLGAGTFLTRGIPRASFPGGDMNGDSSIYWRVKNYWTIKGQPGYTTSIKLDANSVLTAEQLQTINKPNDWYLYGPIYESSPVFFGGIAPINQFVMEDIVLDGNASNQSVPSNIQPGVVTSDYTVLRRVRAQNMKVITSETPFLAIRSLATSATGYGLMDSCEVASTCVGSHSIGLIITNEALTAGYGCHLQAEIRNCLVNGTGEALSNGFQVIADIFTKISGNRFNNTAYGANIDTGTYSEYEISRNTFNHVGLFGFVINLNDANTGRNILIKDNLLGLANNAVAFQVGGNAITGRITGNSVTYTTGSGSGAYLLHTTSGLAANSALFDNNLADSGMAVSIASTGTVVSFGNKTLTGSSFPGLTP